MAQNNCRVYVALQYSMEISYHELHEVEQELMVELQDMLLASGAVHLDFWGYGDSLQLDFSMERFESGTIEELAREIAALLPADVTGRIVGVDKGLRRMAFYTLVSGEAKGSVVEMDTLPMDGFPPPRAFVARPN
ncbi:MAG: hypothetical protein ACOCWR_03125 [Oceanidesulfovibrio sp.]